MATLPAMFVSHGAPTFALAPGSVGRRLGYFGRRLVRPLGIVLVSAHWQTEGVRVSGAARPSTIHDFRGFDPELYQIQYPARGHPVLAEMALDLLQADGWYARIDPVRGLDHGAWVPLRHLYPRADVPVVQVSLPRDLDGKSAWRLGRSLAPLRELGALIIGSGSLTHGLADFFEADEGGHGPARRFRDWVRRAVMAGDDGALIGALGKAPDFRRAHPSPEHYLPLPIAAAAGGLDQVKILEGGWMGGVISMDAFVFGEPKAENSSAVSAA